MNNQFLKMLSNICPQIITDPQILISYETDWRKRYHAKAIAVALPENLTQIQAIVKLCAQAKIAIITQGGNTSNCGGANPINDYPQGQLILNLRRMNKILTLNHENQSLSVEAGCSLKSVQQYAKEHGFYFPLSMSSQDSCQIGGNLATNAGGSQVLKYGMMRDLTLGLNAILANSEELNLLSELRKNNTYLDLKQLLIGSEGTLGIITHAQLKLYPLPHSWCTFITPSTSLKQALQLLQNLRRRFANNVVAFEIIHRDTWKIHQRYFPQDKINLTNQWLILAELETSLEFALDSLIEILVENEIDLGQTTLATNESERQELWHIREQIPLAEKQYGYAAKHDISLPLNQLANFLNLNMPRLRRLIPNGYFSIFGHLGDGNLHYNFGIHNSSLAQIQELEPHVNQLVYQDVINLGGSFAAEHGIGQNKINYLTQFTKPINYQLLQQIKQLLDPENLFNPGKIFPVQ